MPFPSPAGFLDLGIEPRSPAWQVDSLPTEPSELLGKPWCVLDNLKYFMYPLTNALLFASQLKQLPEIMNSQPASTCVWTERRQCQTEETKREHSVEKVKRPGFPLAIGTPWGVSHKIFLPLSSVKKATEEV